MYQPVTVVTPQGQVVTQALSPGTIRIQNSQVRVSFPRAGLGLRGTTWGTVGPGGSCPRPEDHGLGQLSRRRLQVTLMSARRLSSTLHLCHCKKVSKFRKSKKARKKSALTPFPQQPLSSS